MEHCARKPIYRMDKLCMSKVYVLSSLANPILVKTCKRMTWTNPVPYYLQEELSTNHAEKLKVFKNVLKNGSESSLQTMYMIDAMQRLNIDFHFQEEIDEFLRRQYVISSHDLHQVALCFRLLRQQGHYVPAGGSIF